MVNIPVAWNTTQTVNTELSGIQNETSIVQLADGNFVVAWMSDSTQGLARTYPGKDILGQIFDPLGKKIGGEFLLSDPASVFDERKPQLTALPDGGFMIVYEDHFADHFVDYRVNNNIVVREFNLSGIYRPGSGGVAAFDIAGELSHVSKPNIIASTSTSVLVTYFKYDLGSIQTDSKTVGRIYNTVTNTFGAEFQIYDGTPNLFSYGHSSGDQYDVDVLTNNNYVFVVQTFTGIFESRDASQSIIIMSQTGERLFAKLLANPQNLDKGHPSVSATVDGGFIVTWDMQDGNSIEFAKFNSTGTQQFFGVLQDTVGLKDPVIAGLRDGSFVIVFDDNAHDAMAVRHFAADGTDLGRYDFAVTTNGAYEPQVIDLKDGRFAVSWSSGPGNAAFRIMDTRDTANTGSVYAPNRYHIGTVYADTIHTDADAEIVYGHNGNDTIYESSLNFKSYHGGEGDDTLVVNSEIGNGNDSHFGGIGVDTIAWFTQTAGASFDLLNGTATAANGFIEIMQEFENLVGTNHADVIYGNNAVNILGGAQGDDHIKGFDGNDTLYGNAGKDRLEGGNGTDTLDGSFGDDTYVIRDTLDTIIEIDGVDQGDADIVLTTVNLRLLATQEIEIMRAFGTTAVALTGNNFNQVITGNAAANTINGGGGTDTLFGGTGNDSFVFSNALLATNADRIRDFNVQDDVIMLRSAVFTALTATGTLSPDFFRNGTAALDANDHIIFDSTTGTIGYDANGAGGAAAITFATVTVGTALTAADFLVF